MCAPHRFKGGEFIFTSDVYPSREENRRAVLEQLHGLVTECVREAGGRDSCVLAQPGVLSLAVSAASAGASQ